MPRFSFNKSSFLGGELSGRVDGRTDLPQYGLGLKECSNWIVLPSGGVTRRPGTMFVDDVRGSSADAITAARLIPFVVSEDQAYVAILWNNSTAGYTELRVIDAETGIDQTVFYLTLNPVFTDDELAAIQYVQSVDLLFLVVDGKTPYVISRGSTGFSIGRFLDDLVGGSPVTFHQRVPYDLNTGNITMYPSAVTGPITVTASAGYFTAGHVGSYVRIFAGASQGYARLDSLASGTVMNAMVVDDFGLSGPGSATTDWAISEFSSARGFPRSVCIFSQRLVFGGTATKPDTFWASQPGDLYQFEPVSGLLADAQSIALSSSRSNRIQWMDGGKKHTIGTLGGEQVGQFREDGANVFLEYNEETAHGSAYVQPAKTSNAIQFVHTSRDKLREFVYNNDAGGYVSNDLSLLGSFTLKTGDLVSSDGIDDKINQIISVGAPIQMVVGLGQSGKLYTMTRDRGQQIAAWSTQIIGGIVNYGVDVPARVMSICSAPAEAGKYDALFMIVQRTIGGSTKFYLEKLDRFRSMDRLEFLTSATDEWFRFVDCSAGAYSAVASSVFSGFSHLAGEDVDVMADGKYVGVVTVDGGGQITLPSSLTANRVVAGFGYKSRLKTMRQEGGSAIGSSVGAIRRPDRMFVNLYKSRFFKAGFENPEARTRVIAAGSNQATQTDYHDQFCKEIAYVDPGEVMGDPYWTNSWIQQLSLPAGYDDKAVAIILVDKPYPCTVLSLTTRMLESDI